MDMIQNDSVVYKKGMTRGQHEEHQHIQSRQICG